MKTTRNKTILEAALVDWAVLMKIRDNAASDRRVWGWFSNNNRKWHSHPNCYYAEQSQIIDAVQDRLEEMMLTYDASQAHFYI